MRKKSANISKNPQISAKIRKSGFLHFLVFQDFPDFILISGWGLYLRQMLGSINRSMWMCCWDWTGLEFGFEPAAFRIYICTVSACCCIAILKGSSHDWKCPRTARKKETVALGRWDMLVATFPFNFCWKRAVFPQTVQIGQRSEIQIVQEIMNFGKFRMFLLFFEHVRNMSLAIVKFGRSLTTTLICSPYY